MNRSILAAVLDHQVLVLDTGSARVMLMDKQTEQVWRSCRSLTVEEIAAKVGESSSVVASILQALAVVGLVIPNQDRWTHAPVAWV